MGEGHGLPRLTGDGKAAGISTARLEASGGCRVDGFVHKSHMHAWGGLMGAAISWAETAGARAVSAAVSVEDDEKRELFEGLGFMHAGRDHPFELDGREVVSETLELRDF